MNLVFSSKPILLLVRCFICRIYKRALYKVMIVVIPWWQMCRQWFSWKNKSLFCWQGSLSTLIKCSQLEDYSYCYNYHSPIRHIMRLSLRSNSNLIQIVIQSKVVDKAIHLQKPSWLNWVAEVAVCVFWHLSHGLTKWDIKRNCPKHPSVRSFNN